LEGTDTEPYTNHQYQQLAILTRALMAEFTALSPERIVGHCDIAPQRKTDPGASFEWPRYLGMLSEEALGPRI
ncbi:MAG: N-acetylmuramoyl-L-alanine amidase, partial [Shewanella sp.]